MNLTWSSSALQKTCTKVEWESESLLGVTEHTFGGEVCSFGEVDKKTYLQQDIYKYLLYLDQNLPGMIRVNPMIT